ncbi:MAG: alpha/beta hydrolase [Wenzhouxiangellaceae bacterium]
MTPRTLILIALLLLLPPGGHAEDHCSARTADPMFGLGDREQFPLSSALLERDFHILVRLPRSYRESDRVYPMVLLLDGGILFPMLAPYQLMMEVQGSADEVIVVGVSYGGLGFANGNLRGTDFTAPSVQVEYFGGAMAYQEFLSAELLPRLKKTYRIDGTRTVLLGQSLGGQLAIHAALTRPELFSTYVAVNPALHTNLAYFLEPEEIASEGRARLVMVMGSEDDPRFREPALQWLAAWRTRTDRPFDLEVVPLDGEHHATSAPAAYFAVVSRLFPAPVD